MFKLPLNRLKWPWSLVNILEVKDFVSSPWMLAVWHRFTPFCSQRQKPHQLPRMEQGKLGEIINSGGLGERGKARLKRRPRQRKKNHWWRKKKSNSITQPRLIMPVSFLLPYSIIPLRAVFSSIFF